jgi:hypothetical protein
LPSGLKCTLNSSLFPLPLGNTAPFAGEVMMIEPAELAAKTGLVNATKAKPTNNLLNCFMTFSFTEINTSNMVNYGCEFSALFEKKSSQRRVGTECLAGLTCPL